MALLSALAAISAAATVTGDVAIEVEGKAPKSSGNAGVVVWLEPLDAANLPIARPAKRTMLQKNKTFAPHVLIVPVGGTVDFPNADPIFHNAFSNFNGQIFDIGLYPPGTSRSVVFRRAGVVRVFCNIHSSMSAVIVVLRTPYFAISEPDGSFSIPSVPEGSYRLCFYHERASEETLKSLEREIAVPASGAQAGKILVAESSYMSAPHLNKYGKPYGQPTDAADYGSVHP